MRDAVEAQFAGLTGGGVIRGLDRIRRRRNELEYPDRTTPIGDEEIEDALRVAIDIIEFAERLVGEMPVY